MARRSLIRRTVLTFFGATLLTSLLSAGLVSLWAPRALVEDSRGQLAGQARGLVALFEGQSMEQVTRQLDTISRQSSARWQLIGDQGPVYTSPNPEDAAHPGTAAAPESAALVVEVPIDPKIGEARLLRVTRSVAPPLERARLIILSGSIFAASLAFCLFLFSADRLISPLFVELNRLEDVRRDFVANVSHELKTPLTASRGMVETMIDDPDMDAATRRLFLFKVRDQTRRLSALVSDLLALSRIEGDPRSLQVRRIDLRDVIEESVASFWGSLETRGLDVVRSFSETDALIDGDRESIAVAIGNLLDNAIKYSPDKGRIEITLEVVGEEAVFSVKDQGIGIPEAHLDRIFERFYRVDAARSKALGGTGLGLSIVKHIALAHGGNVAVESTLGSGSIFRLILPLGSRA